MEIAYKYGYLLGMVQAVLKTDEFIERQGSLGMLSTERKMLVDALIYLGEVKDGQDVKG